MLCVRRINLTKPRYYITSWSVVLLRIVDLRLKLWRSAIEETKALTQSTGSWLILGQAGHPKE